MDTTLMAWQAPKYLSLEKVTTIKRIVMVLKVLFDGSFNALIKRTPKNPGTN
jgi:hypothetical protein